MNNLNVINCIAGYMLIYSVEVSGVLPLTVLLDYSQLNLLTRCFFCIYSFLS
nr:MAG TPA: hypothetical protein [Caudoviricetes sp.]